MRNYLRIRTLTRDDIVEFNNELSQHMRDIQSRGNESDVKFSTAYTGDANNEINYSAVIMEYEITNY